MSTKLSPRGFAALEALLIVVILATIGGTGYYVWHAKQNADKTNNAAAGVAQSSPGKVTKKKTSTSNTSQKYLTIKEWGVRIPVASSVDVSDIYYSMRTVPTDNNSQEAEFSSIRLAALIPNCDVKNSGGPAFGSVERLTPSAYQAASQSPSDTGVSGGVLLKGYYYVWQDVRGNCAETTVDGGTPELKAKFEALPSDNFPNNTEQLLKNIQSIPN